VDFIYPTEEKAKAERESLVLDSMLDWLFPRAATPEIVTMRAHVLAYICRPNWIGNNSKNVATLAKTLGVSRARLGYQFRKFNDVFGFQAPGQRSDEVRAKGATVAKRNAKALARSRRAAATKRKAACRQPNKDASPWHLSAHKPYCEGKSPPKESLSAVWGGSGFPVSVKILRAGLFTTFT